MSVQSQFLAVYTGSTDSAAMVRWNALSSEERALRQQQGAAAWHAWVDRHQASIVMMGGPLGPTLRVSADGVTAVRNGMNAVTVVQAESREAAAALFADHPHFALCPGEAVEVMPIMPVPGR